MPFAVEGTILFCSGECAIVLDQSRTSKPRLVLDSVEDLIDGEHEGVKCSVGLKVWSGLSERIGSAGLL